MRLFKTLLALLLCGAAFGQTVQPFPFNDYSFFKRFNVGGRSAQVTHPSAQFELKGTDAGFLGPRLTTAQRDAIAAPAEFLMIINSDLQRLQIYYSGAWHDINALATGTAPVTSVFGRTGPVIAQDGDYTLQQVMVGGNTSRLPFLLKSSNTLNNGTLVSIGENTPTAGQIDVMNSASGAQTHIVPDGIQTPSLQLRNGSSGGVTLMFPYSGLYAQYVQARDGIIPLMDDIPDASINLTANGTSGAASWDEPSRTLNIPNYGAGVTVPGLGLVLAQSANAGGATINNLGAPSSGSDAATKSYVDNVVATAPAPNLQAVTTAGATTSNLVTINTTNGGEYLRFHNTDFTALTGRVDATANPFRAYNPFNPADYSAFGHTGVKRHVGSTDYTISFPAATGDVALQQWVTAQNYSTFRPNITSATTGHFLRHNGIEWVNGPIQASDLPTGNTISSLQMYMPGILFNSLVNGVNTGSAWTLTPTLKTQAARTFLRGPVSGSDATPTWGALQISDIPDLSSLYQANDVSQTTYVFNTELTNNSSGSDYLVLATGTGAGTSSITSYATNRPGIVRLAVGTSNTGRAYISSAPTSNPGTYMLGGGTWKYETAVSIPNGFTLSNSTDRYQVAAGFVSSTNGTMTQLNGAFFLYDDGGVTNGSAASGNWQCVTVKTVLGTTTRTVTTLPSSAANTLSVGAWYRMKVQINDDATRADFYVNGSLVATHTTDIPTTAAVGWANYIQKSAGTTNCGIDNDYVAVKAIFTTPR